MTHRQLPEPTQNRLVKYGLDIRVGDLVIATDSSSCGEIYRIGKITKRKIWTQSYWGDKWSSYGKYSYKKYQDKGYQRLDKPIEELEIEVLDEVKNLEVHTPASISEETALVPAGSEEMLHRTERELVARTHHLDIMQAVLTRKMNELRCISSEFKSQLDKIHKVLGIVELYMGIHEKIYQIREGNSAPSFCPISIRQRVLFIDEEFGDPDEEGLDFTRLQEFDTWITIPENLNRFLPEEKGLVAIRPRRQDKRYHSNAWVNSFLNQENHKTYLLIRNGDNLYRIWTGITVKPRLFPTRKEFDLKEDHWSHFNEDRWEEKTFQYKKYGLMIQGILHRTPIFNPIDIEIKVFQPETWGGMLRLIRDDEAMLPTGRLGWRDWQKEINSKIKVGSRIIYRATRDVLEYMGERTDYLYGKWVDPPVTGIYVVVAGIKGETDLKNLRFMYNPGDYVYPDGDWGVGRPRKRRIGFHFYNDEVLNYDQIELADLEFYINCRTERQHYLQMMPLLYMLRKKRLEELEREKYFVQLVHQRTLAKESRIWELVKWWKFRNSWKRPISEDDAKALRMIERKLK